jgi:tRNA-dependent cyclodipeptide synthase
MEIKQYQNINKEDVDSRKNNIFIPICLGNKFFSEKGVLSQNVSSYLDWALVNTKEKVLIVVVDRIQDTNFFIRNNSRTEGASIAHVLKEGDVLKSALTTLVEKLPLDKRSKVEVIKWEDYQKYDPLWAHITHTAYKEFKNNKSFRDVILNCVKTSITDRQFSEEEYLRLCDYVLDEFCIVYSGLKYKEDYFGVYVYPNTDSVSDFFEALKNGDIFPKLKEKLPKEKVGVVILNN